MIAEFPGPGPNTFSIFSRQHDGLYRARRESFVFSLLGQAAIVGVLVYFTSCVIRHTPEIGRNLPKSGDLLLVFSGRNGGGGATTTRCWHRAAVFPRRLSILNSCLRR